MKDTQQVAGLASRLNRELGVWQPIATAPIEVEILIYDETLLNTMVVGKGFEYEGERSFSDCIGGYPYNPTHWMLLPKPPM